MNTLADKLSAAQTRALSIKPKVGGFPVLAEVLRQSGVEMNIWSLPSCQSLYVMKEGSVVQQGSPLVMGTHDVPAFDREALIRALRVDQAGESSFPEFLSATWRAGVVRYEVDFNRREVIYYGALGESYREKYPAVEVSP